MTTTTKVRSPGYLLCRKLLSSFNQMVFVFLCEQIYCIKVLSSEKEEEEEEEEEEIRFDAKVEFVGLVVEFDERSRFLKGQNEALALNFGRI